MGSSSTFSVAETNLVPCHERRFVVFDLLQGGIRWMRVSPSIVFVYGQGDLLVVGEVGVAEDEALDAREDAFNWGEPGCIGGRIDQADVVNSCPADDLALLMGAPIVQDDVEAFVGWVTAPQITEEVQNLLPTLAPVAVHEESVILQVIGR